MTVFKYNNDILYPRRGYPHHGDCRSTNSSLPIFITVCTKDRMPLLANTRTHLVLRELWSDTSRWIVGRYVIMPEHCHFIVMEATPNSTPLRMWVGWWKRRATILLNGVPLVWQRDVWDTVIRDQTTLAEKISYIQNNPVRRGLVHSPSEWPFQGELTRLILPYGAS